MVVVAAIAGWGVAGSWCLRRAAGVDLRAPYEVLALGITIVLAGTGLAVAFDAFDGPAVGVLLAVGAVCTLVGLGRRLLAGGRSVRAWTVRAGTGAVLVAADLLVARWTTATFRWNGCDDDVAYLYLARRLVLRGDLLDPLDNRRLTSPGGMSALQALFLIRLPDSYLPLADLLLGSLLLLLALWRSRSGRWSPWGIAAALAVSCFPVVLGMISTSPLLLPCGLTIVAILIAVRLRAEPAPPPRAEAATAAVLGLLVGAVATLRPDYDLPLGAFALAA